MQNLMSYLLTQNCASQVIAADVATNDIQSTGTKSAIINGIPYVLAVDDAFDISAEAAYSLWATGQSYTTNSEVYHVDPDGETRHYVCILAHTSAAADEIEVGANWETYWRLLPVWATTGDLDSVADGATKYYLVCALSDGTLRIFKAYNATTLAVEIPAYDPTRYVAVALLKYANSTGDTAADVIGAATCDWGTYGSFYQLTGFVIPDVSLLDKN
jgi:hypothetical protein